MKVLCLDCGNTRVKWGLRHGQEWLESGVATYGELPSLSVSADRLLVCNVAGERGRLAVQSLADRLARSVEWVRAQGQQCGVVNGYDHPEQLGADRWAALIAARQLRSGSSLVVNAGTATTIDLLPADGTFPGGLILPGLALMRESLVAATADLPPGGGEFRDLPTNTFDAIISGVMAATLGAIERQFRQIDRQPDPLCLLSGGNALLLKPHLNIACRHEPDLVLIGLATIAG